MSDTRLKSILAIQLHALGLPVPQRDYSQSRQWRADFAWPDYHIALVFADPSPPVSLVGVPNV